MVNVEILCDLHIIRGGLQQHNDPVDARVAMIAKTFTSIKLTSFFEAPEIFYMSRIRSPFLLADL